MSDKLNNVLKKIQAKYGDTSVGLLGNMPKAQVDAISTGIPDVDLAIGIGGLPLGRIIEVYGNEGSGKTSFTLSCIASFQKEGKVCAFIDVEHALDPSRAEQLGVDLSSLIFAQPDTAEEALDLVKDLSDTGEVSLIVVDSVSSLLPKAEDESDMDQNTIGLQARLLSKALRKLTGSLSKNKCTCVFINQIREKVGVMFSNPETTSGGRALRFYSSLRIEVKRGELIGSKEMPEGHTAKVKIVKNKVAAPFKTAEFDIYSDERGIDVVKGMINRCIENGIMTKGGSWIYYPDKDNALEIDGISCKWQSLAKACDDIRSSRILFDHIYSSLINKLSDGLPAKSE